MFIQELASEKRAKECSSFLWPMCFAYSVQYGQPIVAAQVLESFNDVHSVAGQLD